MEIGIKHGNLLFSDEIKLMNRYNVSCVNSFFSELSVDEIYSCQEKITMRYATETDLKSGCSKFYLKMSDKCASLIIAGNPYFAGFKKPLIAHELLEARFNSVDCSYEFNESHEKANKVLLKLSPILNGKDSVIETSWEWSELESLIKQLCIDSNKTIEQVSWYLMPRLVTLK